MQMSAKGFNVLSGRGGSFRGGAVHPGADTGLTLKVNP